MHRIALNRNPHPFVPAPAQARWNSSGVRVAYTSEHPALAALELLGYWNNYPRMQGYRLFSANLPNEDMEEADASVDPHDSAQTRPYGDAWVREARSLALRVPSVVVPLSFNVLINPAHRRFSALTYTDHGEFEYDERVNALLGAAKE